MVRLGPYKQVFEAHRDSFLKAGYSDVEASVLAQAIVAKPLPETAYSRPARLLCVCNATRKDSPRIRSIRRRFIQSHQCSAIEMFYVQRSRAPLFTSCLKVENLGEGQGQR
jgi:hypothetical protein